MATGRLGAASLTTTVNNSVYTCPPTTFSVCTVSICNQSSTVNATINIAVASAATPTTAEYIEYGTTLLPNGVLERTGLVLDAGKIIVVNGTFASGAVSVVVMGIETSTA